MGRRNRSDMPGTFKPVSVEWGRERAVLTPDVEERVLGHVDRDAGVSMRQLGGGGVIICRVWHGNLLYPYHLQRVRDFMPVNFPARENCRCFVI
jgi:hypothetical protein